MTKVEKSMIAVVAGCIVVIFLLSFTISKSIEEAGGIKGIAVSIGKDIKDISKQINEED